MADRDAADAPTLLEHHPEGVWRYARRQGDAVRLVLGTAVLIVTAVLAARGVSAWEPSLFRWINGWPDGLFWPIWTAMQLGTVIVVPIATAVALSFRHRRLALNLAVSGTLAYLSALVVKSLVDRPRPEALLPGTVLRHMSAGGLGYPSGHAAVATALAVALFPYVPRSGRVAIWCGAILVSTARMYVGAHLPLDVIGGAALGTVVGSAVHLVMGAPVERGRHRWVLHRATGS